MTPRRPGLGRAEIAKDSIQALAESTATHVGSIAAILSGAVRDVARELGDLASDVFEMRDAAARASQDLREDDLATSAPTQRHAPPASRSSDPGYVVGEAADDPRRQAMSEQMKAGDGVSDEELVEQVANQTDSELAQQDYFERESDGTVTDTEAAKSEADEARGT